SLPMFDLQAAVKKINEIRSLGVLISLDDFGTGYSSLSYLSEIPFDYVKIDKSFMKHIHNKETVHSAVIQSVIWIAHKLDCGVVVEGAEGASVLLSLADLRGDEAEGYDFHPPLPSTQITTTLKTHKGE